MRSENNKIAEDGMKKIGQKKSGKKRQLDLLDYFNRLLSNCCVFDSFCFQKVSRV